MITDLIPVINVTPLFDKTLNTNPSPAVLETVRAIHRACTSTGFFQIIGTNISPPLIKSLQICLEHFFDLPEGDKLALHVEKGGPAWRGYMPWGGEGTKGRADLKEGLYAGAEHTEEHPLFGNPIYGRNQFPDTQIPELRAVVLNYIDEITELGKVLCDAMSVGLALEHDYMRKHLLDCPEPIQLFRAFRYTKKESEDCGAYGIGEHSDFGLLTILSQHGPGLQMQTPSGDWVDVPVIENGFSCNVGDVLDRMTGGRYISAKHRAVCPEVGVARLSVPFFFDPGWNAKIKEFPLGHLDPLSDEQLERAHERWEKNTTFTGLTGIWAQYLAKKVQKVFKDMPLPDFEGNKAASTRFSIVVPTKAPIDNGRVV